jgi:uncharacterized protein (TIGR02118 family)
MAKLVVMYSAPKDAAAFDKHYFETHVPIAKTIPGLRKYEVNKGPIMTPAGPSAFHLIATLHFDDVAAIQNAFASPQGQAAAADVQGMGFPEGGVQMLIMDAREV